MQAQVVGREFVGLRAAAAAPGAKQTARSPPELRRGRHGSAIPRAQLRDAPCSAGHAPSPAPSGPAALALSSPIRSGRGLAGSVRAFPQQRKPRGTANVVCRAGNKEYSREAKLREEVISPFRTVRMFLSLGFIGSAGIATLITVTRVAGLLAGAPASVGLDLQELLLDLGIDFGALVLFGLLYRNDSKAKDSQLSKLAREESLAQLRVELPTGKLVRVAQLQGACRPVVVFGPLSHVRKALALAEPYKERLLERGVTVVPYVTEDDLKGDAGAFNQDFKAFAAAVQADVAPAAAAEGAAAATAALSPGSTASPDLEGRWLARPSYTNEWDEWLKDQLLLAKVESKAPVYLSLRLDGRVRGSGVGYPPWQVISAQLPPMKGMWSGPFDGMDGRVL